MRYGVGGQRTGRERERERERERTHITESGCGEVQRKTSEEEARAVVGDTNNIVMN
jgi:hypothetical protein